MFVEVYSEHHDDGGNATNTGLHPNATKTLIAFGMFCETMLFAALPVFLSSRSENKQGIIQIVLTALSSLGGGIFLATCFLHLMPEAVEKMEDALKDVGADIELPLPYVIILSGFLLVLLMEEFMHLWTGMDHGHSHGHPNGGHMFDGNSVPVAKYSSIESNSTIHLSEPRRQKRNVLDEVTPNTNNGDQMMTTSIHNDLGSHSGFRATVMVFALSLHSIFEGMAIGLQETTQQVLALFGAIVVHKTVIAMTLSTSLLNSATKLTARVIFSCLIIFSLMSPIGLLIGIGLNSAPAMVNGVMQCIASGTFVYITFFEILPHELSSNNQNGSRLLKIFLLFVGIGIMIIIRIIFPDND